MSGRIARFRQRLRKAWTNIKLIFKVGWNKLAEGDRKAIIRAILALLIVFGIAAFGFAILQYRPKRLVQARVSCKSVELPTPFQAHIAHPHEVTLWGYPGKAENCDRDSIIAHVKQASELTQPLTLDFVRKPSPSHDPTSQLKIIPSRGERLEITSKSAVLTLAGTDRSQPVELKVKSMGGDKSLVDWQVMGKTKLVPIDLPIKQIDVPVDTLDLYPYPSRGAIHFKLESDGPNAALAAEFEKIPDVKFLFDENGFAPVRFRATECTNGSLRFGESVVVPLSNTKTELEFAQIKPNQIAAGISETNVSIDLTLFGEVQSVLLDKREQNPTMLEDILSESPGKKGAFALFVLGVIYLLARLANRALDVLEKVVIPDASGNGGGEDLHQTNNRAVKPNDSNVGGK